MSSEDPFKNWHEWYVHKRDCQDCKNLSWQDKNKKDSMCELGLMLFNEWFGPFCPKEDV